MKIEDFIINYGKQIGISEVGICGTEFFDNIEKILYLKNAQLKGFVEQDIELRINPLKTMPSAKSIIVFCLGYHKKFDFEMDDELRGSISIGAVGLDYHIVLNHALQALAEELKKIVDFEYRIFVDTGPLSDRAVAQRAGIGDILKNGSLCSKNGSMMFIGYMLTDLILNKTKKDFTISCGDCKICVDCCPGKAIHEKGGIDAIKCVSFLTQMKTPLNISQMKTIGNKLYGCDICQIVCPKNNMQKKTIFSDREAAMPRLEEILMLSNKDFKMRFGQTAIFWRGRNVIARNALIALGNSCQPQSVELLKKYSEDNRQFIRESAELALLLKKRE